ncbi:TetR/AcrR family transcriptional regulator [Variovorax arabinosiphilus]|uniref:TetR/AcrR family transcriptional regulator n=1 Tax=Variovorax arabinosiphilus TaxID=3053498 RepID=UPI0025763E21|nr:MULTISPECIES: TetR/AcrR family transcriptional regulator [unclassified Variovorax]MDM0118423.1 TetR/AcrR family transcriptional regulator [Variovorax sp. J2L1-78]MDM0128848.1 TetR/AcrR family transcriptional regulator [Variovorax sp. J2L1-63]MDM0233366.1 TetR/AcrR family transcriptional regulator [Variovorax sp. J2R1-6]
MTMTSTSTTILDHIIDTAGALFYKEGTKSVGVDRIIFEAGVAKATMYRYFSGKDALVAACLQRRHDRVMEALQSGIGKGRPKGHARILKVFELLHDKAESPDFRGCAFMLAVAENEVSDEVRRIARAHKDAVLALFVSLLPSDWPRPAKTAAQLNLLYDGAMAQILVQRNPKAALVAKECAEMILSCSDLHASAPQF